MRGSLPSRAVHVDLTYTLAAALMPLSLSPQGPTLAIRREAFEFAGLSRTSIDSALNLTDAEFRVEGSLIAIGPLPGPDDVPDLIDMFEEAGLVYFDDFMEIPGGMPEWLELFARHRAPL